ncbi:MAG: class I SAM-dependent RNA methyltransferase [Treponema sp.]|nr:class I SAM-dependent RNA methyltransferase [Treponema sp.]
MNNAVALCAVGAEKAVSNEIKKLSPVQGQFTITDSGFGRVRFRTDTAGLYRTLMGLRAADRILLETGFFPAADFDALFAQTQAIPWETLVPARRGLKVVKVRSNRSKLKAETSIQAIVHKAAAQRLCTAHGLTRLPATTLMAEVRVYIEKDMVSLLLDLSGEPLFKRGYRKEGGIAPLRETTAAAMLLLSGWKRKYPLYDPFCGSGTILTEALMYAWDIAPGLCRRFAISDLLIADNTIEETVRDELRGKINAERTIRIAGSDEDAKTLAIAKSNIDRLMAAHPAAGMQTAPIALKTVPMKEAQWEAGGEDGFIVTNPPYGKRLGDQAASEQIYGEMAALARNFPQWKLAVITDHPGYESFFGKKADSCREISNGPIPSYFFQYEKL